MRSQGPLNRDAVRSKSVVLLVTGAYFSAALLVPVIGLTPIMMISAGLVGGSYVVHKFLK